MSERKTEFEGSLQVESEAGDWRTVSCFTDHVLFRPLSGPPQWVLNRTRFEFEDGSAAECPEPGRFIDPVTGVSYAARGDLTRDR